MPCLAVRNERGTLVAKVTREVYYNSIQVQGDYRKEGNKVIFTSDQTLSSRCGDVKVYLWKDNYIVLK